MTDLYLYPPTVDLPYPFGELPSGTVILYDNGQDWNGASLTITTGNSAPSKVISFIDTNMENRSDWIIFNLPTGVVMTLMNNPITTATNPYNFAGADVCVDLIGNGTTQTVNLRVFIILCKQRY